MSVSFDIFVPVRTFKVDVTLVPRGGLSLLERHAILAIHDGATNVDALRAHLGLPPRMVIDLCIDLLVSGAIELSSTDGGIGLSQPLQTRLGDASDPQQRWVEAVDSRAGEVIELTLVQDLVAGAVFPRLPFRADLRAGLPTAPIGPDASNPNGVAPIDLILAATRHLRSRSGTRSTADDQIREFDRLRASRVGDVRMQPDSRSSERPSTPSHGRVPMTMVARRSASGDATFEIVGPAELPPAVRSRISAALHDAWEADRGKAEFFDRLTWCEDPPKASTSEPPGISLEQVLSTLASVRASVDLGRTDQHAALVTQFEVAREAIEDARISTAAVELVRNASHHHDIVLEALQEASSQVVMACPWLRQLDVNSEFQRALENAIDRGISVTLLWGIGRQDKLEEQVDSETMRWLSDLTQRSNGRLQVPTRSARIHAKVVACDMRWVLVTSHNFMSSGRERVTEELGVRVRASSTPSAPTKVSRIAIDSLRWLRSAVPQFELRRNVFDAAGLFGMQAPDATVDLTPSPSEANTDWGAPGVSVWQREWRSAIDTLSANAVGLSDVADVVRDAEHRYLLLLAVDKAQKRLLVQSPALSHAFLAPLVLERLKAAVARGVNVQVITSDTAPGASDLANVGARVRTTDSHAKLLVCDDWAVVSSFNFLSFEGRDRRELGVRLTHSPIIEHLWQIGQGHS